MENLTEQASQEKRDAVELLYNNSYGGLLVSAITSCALVFSFHTEHVQIQKYYWLASLLSILIIRSIDLFHWKFHFSKSDYNCKNALLRFNIGVTVTAVLWCSYIFIVAGKAQLLELSASLIVISALASGAATILAASRYAAMTYSGILLVPCSLYLIFLQDFSTELLGSLGLIFAVVIVIVAKKMADFTQKAIQLKNHNRLLVEEMESEVEKRTDEIYKLSNLDPLTKLHNRSAFSLALAELLFISNRTDQKTAVLFIDLDGFKQVNDAFGHEIGDKVLRIVTTRLTEFKLNGHLGRWGGDEFVVAIPNCSELQAVEIGTRIIETISDSIQIESLKLNVGASIGVSLAPDHSLLEQELIQFADIAMYKQKNSGEALPRVFSNELYLELRKEEALREGLRDAIKRDEFFVVYQPILDFDTGNIASCEALLRWNFQGQLISPIVFIEICEQMGLIIEIGKWVLQQACKDAMQWRENGKLSKAKIAVNVSIVQLLEKSFIDCIDETLRTSGLPPERLILEITESTLAENKTYIEQLLEQIKLRNILISIDDFGTGYSSMSQLQSLPFDIIKIDRSFVSSLDNKGEAIIKATLFIAQELQCKTVAEGIETQHQAEQLKLLGASYLQGFYFAKPMKQLQVRQFLHDNSAFDFLRESEQQVMI